MKKFYKFTKTDVNSRKQELREFIDKYNSKYKSYKSVIKWLALLNVHYILDKDGFEFEDPDTCEDEWLWGHGGLVKYSRDYHIVVNDNIDLGTL